MSGAAALYRWAGRSTPVQVKIALHASATSPAQGYLKWGRKVGPGRPGSTFPNTEPTMAQVIPLSPSRYDRTESRSDRVWGNIIVWGNKLLGRDHRWGKTQLSQESSSGYSTNDIIVWGQSTIAQDSIRLGIPQTRKTSSFGQLSRRHHRLGNSVSDSSLGNSNDMNRWGNSSCWGNSA